MSVRAKAVEALQGARHKHRDSASRIPLELITMALMGKKVNFDKVMNTGHWAKTRA